MKYAYLTSIMACSPAGPHYCLFTFQTHSYRNLADACRASAEAASPPQADEAQMQSLKEQAASLQAALTNSESHKHSLELELGDLRREVDSLRAQVSSVASSPSLERQVKEVSFFLLVLGFKFVKKPKRPSTMKP